MRRRLRSNPSADGPSSTRRRLIRSRPDTAYKQPPNPLGDRLHFIFSASKRPFRVVAGGKAVRVPFHHFYRPVLRRSKSAHSSSVTASLLAQNQIQRPARARSNPLPQSRVVPSGCNSKTDWSARLRLIQAMPGSTSMSTRPIISLLFNERLASAGLPHRQPVLPVGHPVCTEQRCSG